MYLNVQSVYTFLSSTLEIEAYVAKAAELGYSRLGLADKQVMHGAYAFYEQAQKHGVKPMIGLHITMPGLLDQSQTFSFLLYATDYTGYQALMVISKLLSQESMETRKIWEVIQRNGTSLIWISLGRTSELEQALIYERTDVAQRFYQHLQDLVPKEHIYIGIQASPYNALEVETVLHFAERQGIQAVIAQPVNMLETDDARALEVLEAIRENETISLDTVQYKGESYLYAPEELQALYERHQLGDLWHNTQDLIAQINLEFPEEQQYLPKFQSPKGEDSDAYLKRLTQERLQAIGRATEAPYIERLEHELHTIATMGFSDYFLIVWDIIAYARASGIRVGPGRGSAAGSLVSYLLQITLVDPLEYDLLFERFLNPERYTMPDIDIDIPDDRRDQVIQYVEQKYGHQQVAQIATFGTFGAKASVRDTLRVLDAPKERMQQWSRAIPTDQNQAMTLQRAYQESADLRRLVDEQPENRTIYAIAQTIEGLPRHTSTHAAAVVIHDEPLERIIPVTERPQAGLMTQFSMYDVEAIGLLKMDFLGLKNLSILDRILRNIQRRQGEVLDINQIPMDDAQTLGLFRSGDTNGVFQFESEGIQNVLKQLKPTSFEDIVAVNALYRPGPMQQIQHFIRRKHGQEAIEYIHPDLEPILKNTYGIIVYQEQVMQILVRMGGFTMGEADMLRRAMSKKQADVMAQERSHFIQGATERGYEAQIAKEVYDYIYAFSNYGFNRAHAVVYSTLAYQLAYLKAHYPLEFYQAVIASGRSIHTSLLTYLREARKRLGRILPIDVNRSLLSLSIDGTALRLGFEQVKGIRRDLAKHIVDDRNLLGPYQDFQSFLRRLPDKFREQELLESLIEVGAFDSFGYNRATLSYNLPNLLQSLTFSGQSMSLFEELEPRIELQAEWPLHLLYEKEREHLGFSSAGHPLDAYEAIIASQKALYSVDQLNQLKDGSKVQVIGLVEDVRRITTKRQEPMAFMQLSSELAHISAVIFPNTYQRVHKLLKDQEIVHVRGKLGKSQRGERQLVVEQMERAQTLLEGLGQPANQAPNNTSNVRCFIRVQSIEQAQVQVNAIKQLALDNPGPAQIILVDAQRQSFLLDKPYLISYSRRVQQEVKQIFGEENVIFQ